MSFFYASQYGPELILDATTKPVINTTFTVTSLTGSAGLATIYKSYDKTQGTVGSGAATTDGAGNLSFFVDPGYYNVSGTVNGTAVVFSVVVPLFPLEPSVDAVGTMSFFAGPVTAIPLGTLVCDGSAVSRTTYAILFGVIGTAFGAGDGTSTFNLPDLRSRVPLGAGQGATLSAYSLGQVGGEELHVLSVAELASHTHGDTGHGHGIADPGHNHGVNDPGHNHVPNSGTSFVWTAPSSTEYLVTSNGGQAVSWGAATDAVSTGVYLNAAATAIGVNAGYANNASVGSGSAHNNLQPYLAGYWVVKF